MKQYFIPELSTQAGNCLTAENWEQAGVEMASYSLSSLLMKPGYDLLKSLPSLASYVGWQRPLVLNATMPSPPVNGSYTLRSSYDGSRSHYTVGELLALIIQLSPQVVILPQGMNRHDEAAWLSLPETIVPFFPVEECPQDDGQRLHGVHFPYDGLVSSRVILFQQLTEYNDRPRYVSGNLSVALLRDLAEVGVTYLESDKPASDAYQGLVYHLDDLIAIDHETQAMQFDVIDTACACATCDQKFTRAYLHHLFQHTPLLCQRLLIQHNVFHALHHLRRDEIPI